MNVKGLSTLFIAAHLEQHGIPVKAVTLIPPEEAEYENAVIDLTDTVRVIHAVPSPGSVGLAHVQTGTTSSEAATPSSGPFCETLDALLSAVRDALGIIVKQLRTSDRAYWPDAVVDLGYGTGKDRWKKPTLKDWRTLNSGPQLTPEELALVQSLGVLDIVADRSHRDSAKPDRPIDPLPSR